MCVWLAGWLLYAVHTFCYKRTPALALARTQQSHALLLSSFHRQRWHTVHLNVWKSIQIGKTCLNSIHIVCTFPMLFVISPRIICICVFVCSLVCLFIYLLIFFAVRLWAVLNATACYFFFFTLCLLRSRANIFAFRSNVIFPPPALARWRTSCSPPLHPFHVCVVINACGDGG